MTNKTEAINQLVGGAFTVKFDGSVKYHDGQTPPTEKAIEAKIKELQADYDAKKYQRDRAVAYDPIQEQLDQIYHDMDGWKAKIKAVKDKYPKP
jgi:hypothetical protein